MNVGCAVAVAESVYVMNKSMHCPLAENVGIPVDIDGLLFVLDAVPMHCDCAFINDVVYSSDVEMVPDIGVGV